MLIEVTQSDINLGGFTGCSCPVALALKRHWPEAACGATQFETRNCSAHTAHDLPDKAVNWIADWDRRLPVKPFTFEVSV